MTWLACSNCPAATRRCSGLGAGRLGGGAVALTGSRPTDGAPERRLRQRGGASRKTRGRNGEGEKGRGGRRGETIFGLSSLSPLLHFSRSGVTTSRTFLDRRVPRSVPVPAAAGERGGSRTRAAATPGRWRGT